MRKIAVVGSRSYDTPQDWIEFRKTMLEIIQDDEVMFISGGANGSDTMAEKFAKLYSIPILIWYANWNKFKKSAGFIRNQQIVDNAEELIAFWDGESKGTQHSIELANKKGIPVTVINIIKG